MIFHTLTSVLHEITYWRVLLFTTIANVMLSMTSQRDIEKLAVKYGIILKGQLPIHACARNYI